jgi:hypothetical protein
LSDGATALLKVADRLFHCDPLISGDQATSTCG